MVEKKLLTLAGVVGILACGACFLPPLPQHEPPPPPALRAGAEETELETVLLTLDVPA